MNSHYLELADLLVIAAKILGHESEVRDFGLLESALARPQATIFGDDAYASLDERAAALLLSLVGNHALVDGNKRLGWVATRTFYRANDADLKVAPAEGRDFILAIASGEVVEVATVARRLAGWRFR